MKLSLCFDLKIVQRFIFGVRCLKRRRIEMNRKMNVALVLLVAFAGMVMAAGFASCSKKDGGTASSASATKISSEAFNLDLPLTYNVPTAFVSMYGLPHLSAKASSTKQTLTTTTPQRWFASQKRQRTEFLPGFCCSVLAGRKP
jgi:hypothetical protein